MPNFLTKLPYQITGDSYEQLQKYDPNSRKKISILGWFSIIPTFLWFLSSFLLCYIILETCLWIALLAGVVAGVMIFIFERNIVQSVKANWLLTILRISLGLFIALFSSVILDLVIFKNDIDYYSHVKVVENQQEKIIDASNKLQAAVDKFNQEMEGSSNSKMKGFGPIAQEKKDQVKEAKMKVEEAQAELQKIQEQFIEPNPESIKLSSSMGLNTILNRIILLHEFVSQNKLALGAWLILLMIGVLLEIFGVLTKFFYPKSVYELDLEAMTQVLANKRIMILEQSMYYTNVGVHGRGALDKMENRNQSIFN